MWPSFRIGANRNLLTIPGKRSDKGEEDLSRLPTTQETASKLSAPRVPCHLQVRLDRSTPQPALCPPALNTPGFCELLHQPSLWGCSVRGSASCWPGGSVRGFLSPAGLVHHCPLSHNSAVASSGSVLISQPVEEYLPPSGTLYSSTHLE